MEFSKSLLAEVGARATAVCRLNLYDRAVFLRNLVFLYHVIRASEQLLEIAQKVAPEGSLREYYKQHKLEEANHAEWLFTDLTDAGVELFPCPLQAAQLAGSQYYHLLHTSPAALLGYIFVMESFPPEMELVEDLEAVHGKELLRTTRYHAENDPDHSKSLYDLLDTLPTETRQVIRQVALDTVNQLSAAMWRIQGGF